MKSKFFFMCLFSLILYSNNDLYSDTIEKYIVQPVGYSQDNEGSYVDFGSANIARWSGTNINWYLHVLYTPGGEVHVVDNYTEYNKGFNPPSLLNSKNAIAAACSTWQAVDPATVTFTFVDTTSVITYDGFDEKNVVFWSSTPFGENAVYWAKVALTTDSNNNIIDADVGFNTYDVDKLPDRNLYWGLRPDDTVEYLDIQGVATHELGHVLGLGDCGHKPYPNELPYPTMFPGSGIEGIIRGRDQRALSDDDRVGVSFLYGGYLIGSKTLSYVDYSEFFFDWNVTIKKPNILNPPSQNPTLVLNNAPLKMKDGVKLVIDDCGILRTQNAAAITRQATQNWSGLDIKNNGKLETESDFIIEYANCGIDLYSGSAINNGNNIIKIRNCSQAGVWADNTTTPIRNILCDNTSTSSYQNGAITVSGSTSAPRISRVKVLNSYYGIKIASTTSNPIASLDSCIVRSSTSDAIVVNSNARVDLNGKNNIHYQSGCKALNNPSSGTIDGNNNYWGTSNPTSMWSTLITFPNLVTKDIVSTTPFDSTNIAGVYKNAIAIGVQESLYEQADKLELSGNWADALEMYEKLIQTEANPGNKKFILLSMLRICDNYSHDYSKLIGIIENELKNASSWYKGSLDFLLCDISLREGKPIDALSAFQRKIGEYKGTSTEVEMLARVAGIYGNYLDDKSRAKEYAEKAARLNPGQESLRMAFALADIEYNPHQYEDKFKGDIFGKEWDPISEGDSVDEFISVTPNPANPVTTITYSIRNPSNVRLSIFNINGQKVATLVNSLMSAGAHSVTFDGSKYASGVYFYRFESAGLSRSGKMLLLK